MFTKINTHSAYNSPTFNSLKLPSQHITAQKASLPVKSQEQIRLLKSVCSEIFSSFALDKSLLPKLESLAGFIKLTPSSILLGASEKDFISFSMPKVGNNTLFHMEITKDSQPVTKIILDSFDKLIKSYDDNITYLLSNEVDQNSLSASIENIFNASDAPLFDLRMFIRRNCSDNKVDFSSIIIPNISDYRIMTATNHSEKKLNETQNKLHTEKFPTISEVGNFSYREIIKQQEEKTKKELAQKTEKDTKNNSVEIVNSEQKSKRKSATKRIKSPVAVEPKPAEEKEAVKKKITGNKKVKSLVVSKPKVKVKKTPVKKKVVDKKKAKLDENIPKNKPGRPRKNPQKSVVDKISDLLPKKKLGRPKAQDTNIKSAGTIGAEALAKINKIFGLNNFIETFMKSISSPTRHVVYSSYAGLKVRKSGFIFNDIDLRFFRRSGWNGAKGMSIADANNKINLFDNGFIPVSNADLSKTAKLDTMQYLTQSEMDDEQYKTIFDKLLDKTIIEMEKYKTFLERRGWRSVERRIAIEDEGKIAPKQFELLKIVEEKYNALRYKLMHMNSGKSCCIKRDYGIVPIKSARLEFIDAYKDGYNLIFSKLKTRYGELYLVVKHSGKDVLEEVFAITQDGRLIKNINKNFGLNKIINHKERDVKYVNNEQIEKENLLPKLELILEKLNEKIDDCEEYIKNYQYIKK